jgi:hypothetical protein
MKTTYKAALLSLFVCPGAGHIYLKRYGRGLELLLMAICGLGFLVWSVTASALQHLETSMAKMQGGTPGLQEISEIVGSKSVPANPYSHAVLFFIACVWVFAIIDAYRIAKQRDIQHNKSSTS